MNQKTHSAPKIFFVKLDSHSPHSRGKPLIRALKAVSTVSVKVSPSPNPPPFSSLHFPSTVSQPTYKEESFETQLEAPPAFTEHATDPQPSSSNVEEETKAALPRDLKDPSGPKDLDDGEPPPPYTEGSSPLEGFTYVMAAAGGASSIITQVSQGGGGPLNALSGTFSECKRPTGL